MLPMWLYTSPRINHTLLQVVTKLLMDSGSKEMESLNELYIKPNSMNGARIGSNQEVEV